MPRRELPGEVCKDCYPGTSTSSVTANTRSPSLLSGPRSQNAAQGGPGTALDAKRPRKKIAVPEPPGRMSSNAYYIDERETAVIQEIIFTNQKEFQ